MGKNTKIIVLVTEGCPACSQVKQKIGKNKRFQLMDVTTNPEARQLAKKLGVTGVPTFLYSNKNGQVCTINDAGKVEKCIKEPRKNEEK